MLPSPWRTTAVAGALLVACATERLPSRGADPAEVFVDVVPSQAELTVDGSDVGPGARTVPITQPAHVYAFRATAPGFAPAERQDEGARLVGTRVGLVLAPVGWASARRLELDDPESLASAASALMARGNGLAALEYAQRAVDAAPRAPRLHRMLADVAATVGRPHRAAAEYGAYLRLEPDAADRAEVEHRIAMLSDEEEAPGIEVGPGAPDGGGR